MNGIFFVVLIWMNVKFDWHQKRKWRPGWKWINRNVKQSALKSFCAVAKTLESSVGRVSRLIGHLIGRFFGPLHGPKKEKIIFLCFNQALVTRVPPGGLGLNFSARKSPRWDLEWADWILFFLPRHTQLFQRKRCRRGRWRADVINRVIGTTCHLFSLCR